MISASGNISITLFNWKIIDSPTSSTDVVSVMPIITNDTPTTPEAIAPDSLLTKG